MDTMALGRPQEANECKSAVRRFARALARKTNDPADLMCMVEAVKAVDDAMVEAIVNLRNNGFSWADIAVGLGTTRQAAQQRFGKAVAEKQAAALAA
jgi:hypothetical protein